MNAVDAGLYTAMTADIAGTATGTLGQLGATGAYRMIAPQTASAPFIVFNELSGVSEWTMADRSHKSLLYQVKAIGEGHSAVTPAAMSDRLDAVLNDQPITVSGWTCKRIRRESDIEYVEDSDGKLYQHVGGIYRIDVEPS